MKKATYNYQKENTESEPNLIAFYENPSGRQFSVIQISKKEFLVVGPGYDYFNVKKRATKASALKLVEKLINKLNSEIIAEKQKQIEALKNECKALNQKDITRFIRKKNTPTTGEIFYTLWFNTFVKKQFFNNPKKWIAPVYNQTA
jgi:hypothetical protein